MASVEEHYEELLARHYTWMRGDYKDRVRENRELFEGLGIRPERGGAALDLGCGSGFQSVALARLGFRVVGVDSSETLLAELGEKAASDLDISTVKGDLRRTGLYRDRGPFEVVVCMGDTLTHLGSRQEVRLLLGDLHRVVEPKGWVVFQFRDLTTALEGSERAVPVRMEENRIMATFLEYEAERVNVHDMIFSREGSGWTMHKSAYVKLRLGAGEIAGFMEEAGFKATGRYEEAGFSVITGRRQA
ncbi:class I SAM-dependent methyltransferase [Rubrobacter indicoceani]|uniref:class I SAM-dependent methyltransferase n=1 Tax=Rubrobacter indicoceani TaxID=2051957 RepID=UPI000E5BC571|nr:class I SAM-dependent methyltransferase [Rubrobacter indicoceani]